MARHAFLLLALAAPILLCACVSSSIRPTRPQPLRWPSGAEQTTHPVACLANGLTQQLLVERPKDAPGLEQDVRFAGAYEQAQATRAAAAEQERATIESAAVQAHAANDASARNPKQ